MGLVPEVGNLASFNQVSGFNPFLLWKKNLIEGGQLTLCVQQIFSMKIQLRAENSFYAFKKEVFRWRLITFKQQCSPTVFRLLHFLTQK